MHPPTKRESPIAIDEVSPLVDGGRFPVRRLVGEPLRVSASVVRHGDEVLDARLRWRSTDARAAREIPMEPAGDDRWWAELRPSEVGRFAFTVVAWRDPLRSWTRSAARWLSQGEPVDADAPSALDLLRRGARRARGLDRSVLREAWQRAEASDWADLFRRVETPEFRAAWRRWGPRPERAVHPWVPVLVEREAAGYGSWYELFVRSQSPEPGRSGRFRDVERRLPQLRDAGFTVLYLTPIHPIGRTNRRGRENAPAAGPTDPGSPWAIGAAEGGHTAIHPDLGTMEEFDHLVAAAREHGLEIALDLAFQCSPDHPWVGQHPDWFAHRPDGTIRYAENPPKRYPDIYPLNFETRDWRSLWVALRDVVLFWADRGIRIFRVDNPHTKPLAFWSWLLPAVRSRYPDTVFLAEAFTRPRVMYRLAKLGFSMSYTYFTWRNTADELRSYFSEITRPPVSDFFRPMLFPTTPDILPPLLQQLGRPAFAVRAVLAATLSPLWGLYSGYEFAENEAQDGTEEFRHSEKYEIVVRPDDAPESLWPLIRRLNQLRAEHPALRARTSVRFLPVESDGGLLGYARYAESPAEELWIVANPIPDRPREGMVTVPIGDHGLPPHATYEVEDLLTGERWTWHGARNYVRLDPAERVAHVFQIRPGGGTR